MNGQALVLFGLVAMLLGFVSMTTGYVLLLRKALRSPFPKAEVRRVLLSNKMKPEDVRNGGAYILLGAMLGLAGILGLLSITLMASKRN